MYNVNLNFYIVHYYVDNAEFNVCMINTDGSITDGQQSVHYISFVQIWPDQLDQVF